MEKIKDLRATFFENHNIPQLKQEKNNYNKDNFNYTSNYSINNKFFSIIKYKDNLTKTDIVISKRMEVYYRLDYEILNNEVLDYVDSVKEEGINDSYEKNSSIMNIRDFVKDFKIDLSKPTFNEKNEEIKNHFLKLDSLNFKEDFSKIENNKNIIPNLPLKTNEQRVNNYLFYLNNYLINKSNFEFKNNNLNLSTLNYLTGFSEDYFLESTINKRLENEILPLICSKLKIENSPENLKEHARHIELTKIENQNKRLANIFYKNSLNENNKNTY